ncbi:MAG: hypothetical protein FWB88_01885 [Defluviitaleaceae bacterium]|nr:hypothetical protein [Defluviitaleaceae bacterium]MCL2238844.1 hypothetical protein [Defluviitaleaceae bacterium]
MVTMVSTALAFFGLESRRMIKDKGAFICHGEKGAVRLTKTEDPPHVIQLAHAVKEHLAQRGFTQTDRYIVAETGLPYVQLGIDRYTATRISGGREMDFASPSDVMEAISHMGRFHAAARGFTGEIPSADSHALIIRQGSDVIQQALKQIRRQKLRSDFDILLIKNAPCYEARMAQAAQTLSASPCAALYAQAMARNHICHNALKEEYIFIGEGYFSHFTAVTQDIQLTDLAAFIRRYALGGDASLPLAHLLEAYNKNNPLPNGSEAVLRGLLNYPAPFIKIVKQYYSKKRSWTPAGLNNRMEAVLAGQARYDAYLEQ